MCNFAYIICRDRFHTSYIQVTRSPHTFVIKILATNRSFRKFDVDLFERHKLADYIVHLIANGITRIIRIILIFRFISCLSTKAEPFVISFAPPCARSLLSRPDLSHIESRATAAVRAPSRKSQCCASLRGARTCPRLLRAPVANISACVRGVAWRAWACVSLRPSTFIFLDLSFPSRLRHFSRSVTIDFRSECAAHCNPRNFGNFRILSYLLPFASRANFPDPTCI